MMLSSLRELLPQRQHVSISIASTHHTGMQLKGCYSCMSVRGSLLREGGKMYTLTCAISVSHSSKCSKVCEDAAL